MLRKTHLAGGAAALVLMAAVAACNDTKDLVNPPPPADPLFTSYVALGNSITAGFQSGGINDSTQQQSYANLLAQSMGTAFVMPLLKKPGCPAPIDNFLTQHRLDDSSATSCALRNDAEGVPVINDVAVPGANVADLTDAVAPSGNALTTFILGGKTQVQRALDARPTFASVWIGNNDVLGPALSGILQPTPGLSAGLTSPAAFVQSYAKVIAGLQAAPTLKGGVLIGVVNVAAAPIFFPGAALNDPRVIGAIDLATGKAVTVDASCTPTTPALIDFQLIAAIAAGSQPAEIACAPTGTDLVGQIYVLDANELPTLVGTVAQYNAYIHAKADSLGWAYVDPNDALAALRADTSVVPVFPRLDQPSKPFGDYISIDGVHPAAAAHQLIAGIIAQAIDAKYGTHIGGAHAP
jgi:hypothetical protein